MESRYSPVAKGFMVLRGSVAGRCLGGTCWLLVGNANKLQETFLRPLVSVLLQRVQDFLHYCPSVLSHTGIVNHSKNSNNSNDT